MTALYPEKRNGNPTGVWIADFKVRGKRVQSRFVSQKEAQQWLDRIGTRNGGVETDVVPNDADAGTKQPLQLPVYPERRNGRLTKRWIAEAPLHGKLVRSRFDTLEEGERWVHAIKHISAQVPRRENVINKQLSLGCGEKSRHMVTFAKLQDEDRRLVCGEIKALENFFVIRDTMPAQYIKAFLLVAEQEGLGVIDYAKRACVSVSVMSRHLLDIGERNRHMEPGFGLVRYRSNPVELRRHEYFLTDKGHALLHKLLREWKGSER